MLSEFLKRFGKNLRQSLDGMNIKLICVPIEFLSNTGCCNLSSQVYCLFTTFKTFENKAIPPVKRKEMSERERYITEMTWFRGNHVCLGWQGDMDHVI